MNNAELFTSKALSPKTIAIVGGGIASVCLADHIFKVKPDTKITIFCKDSELSSRGSGNKQGAIYPLLQGSRSVISEFYADSFDYALDYYQTLLNNVLDVEHGFTGVLQQAIKPELEDRLQKVANVWPEHCQFLTAEESSKIANIELPFSSIFFKSAGWIWPQQFCQQLAYYLQNQFNLEIKLNTKVTALSQSKAWGVIGKDEQNFGEFDAVVMCSGHSSNTFQQFNHIPLQSVRGQVSRFHSGTKLSALKTVLCHKGYVTPSQSDYQCFGATFVKDDNNELVRASEREANLNQLKKVYAGQSWAQSISLKDVIGDKAAIRAMSPDHLPITGELFSNDWIREQVDKNTGKLHRIKEPQNSDLRGLYTLTALGARGLTSGPLLAKHLTSLLFGMKSPLNDRMQKAISTKRFQVKQLKQLKNKF